jgi:hypothetical protein
VEHLVDVYWLSDKQMFVPWTEGFALSNRINLILDSDLSPRVKRMRVRPLEERLKIYFEKKYGPLPNS